MENFVHKYDTQSFYFVSLFTVFSLSSFLEKSFSPLTSCKLAYSDRIHNYNYNSEP